VHRLPSQAFELSFYPSTRVGGDVGGAWWVPVGVSDAPPTYSNTVPPGIRRRFTCTSRTWSCPASRAVSPGVRRSGYTDDAVVRHGVLDEGMPYLQKRFAPRALASKVREVLGRT
jgi:hypothetical protein